MNDKKMVDYLNEERNNDFMLIGYLLDNTDFVIEKWKKQNFITKEELTALKYASTYLTKFYNSVLSRLNPKEYDKIGRRLKSYRIHIVDKFTADRIERKTKQDINTVVFKRQELENFLGEVMYCNCTGCNKHWASCRDVYPLLYNNFTEESGENLDNCRYARARTETGPATAYINIDELRAKKNEESGNNKAL